VWAGRTLGVPPPSAILPRSWPPEKVGENATFPQSLCCILGRPVPILPIFTSHIVDQFLPIAWCRLQSPILSKTRPPEESPHQTCRAFRGESDSSTLEVVRRLVSGSF